MATETLEKRVKKLERWRISHARRLSALDDRDSEREHDIEESEDRQMAALADLKSDLKADIRMLALATVAILSHSSLASPESRELVDIMRDRFKLDELMVHNA